MKTWKVLFQPEGKSVQVDEGSTLLEAARRAGIHLNAPCGGLGVCGNCKVEISQGNASQPGAAVPQPATPGELHRLREEEIARGMRLACRTRVTSDLAVFIPDETRLFDQKILEAGTSRKVDLAPLLMKEHVKLSAPELPDQRADVDRIRAEFKVIPRNVRIPWHTLRHLPGTLRHQDYDVTAVALDGELICLEPGDTTSKQFGVAVDIGTTTVVGTLIDLRTGADVAVASRTNPQVAYGDDVVSRIRYATEEKGGLAMLQSKIIGCLNDILHELANRALIRAADVYEVVAAGNTTMMHLLLGVDPYAIAQAPYVAAYREGLSAPAADFGLNIHRCGKLTVLPNIAGFVGADTVAVVLATDMHHSGEMKLAIDIGTNGEMVIGTRDRLLSCSTAAGPAFEGARIKFGMRAATGAVESVDIDDDVRLGLIGGDKVVGICGTGLIDAVAELLRIGIIDVTGRIRDPADVPDVPDKVRARIRTGENGNDFVLAQAELCGSGEPVYLTQRDVREVQLAKAAIFAGIQIMKKELGITDEGLTEVLLAGAFGNYIRPERAQRIGLLPPVDLARIRFVGNAASTGAKLALVNRTCRAECDEISLAAHYVELAGRADFQEEFSSALLFGTL